MSSVTEPYPSKSDAIGDRPASDSGNFGRLARAGVMADYIAELFEDKLTGIPLSAWQRFLALFTENRSADAIDTRLARLASAFSDSVANDQSRAQIAEKFGEIFALLRQ